jgi:GT2 family glycosyltransferase
MRASLIIAAHNEGEHLWKTVQACWPAIGGLDCELLVADDASTDGSIDATLHRFPQVRVVRHISRLGASPTKASGAQAARGDTLIFLDGHTNPEPGAIARLVEDAELADHRAIITPKITALCTITWRNKTAQSGSGYYLNLDDLSCGWLPESRLSPAQIGRRRFLESPALIGCALAVSRRLYDELAGFDSKMRYWGVEDLDFGLKCWLAGYRILHDPGVVVGHRFRATFDNYSVPAEHLLANQLRLARKNFSPSVWARWVDDCRQRHLGRLDGHPEGLWASAWTLFQADELSAEAERSYLQARRQRDEFWYAERFDLTWPKLVGSTLSHPVIARGLLAADQAAPSPSPSPPPPCGCVIQWSDGTAITDNNRNVLPGAQINLKLVCPDGSPTNIMWSLPGSVFKNYVISSTAHQPSATLTNLSAADLSASAIQFYWADVGNGRNVSVTFTLNGQQCSVQATFNLRDPIVTFPDGTNPPVIGQMQLVPFGGNPFTDVELFLLGSDDGIQFEASVTLPPGFGFGAALWEIGQLTSGYRAWKLASNGSCEKGDTNGVFFNDDPWPNPTHADPSPPPWTTAVPLASYSVGDTPSQPLSGTSQVVGANSWVTYIMFKPAADPPRHGPSVWVPLRSLSWEASWCAQLINGNWQLVTQTARVLGPWSDNRVPPTWSDSFSQLPVVPMKVCPPACG